VIQAVCGVREVLRREEAVERTSTTRILRSVGQEFKAALSQDVSLLLHLKIQDMCVSGENNGDAPGNVHGEREFVYPDLHVLKGEADGVLGCLINNKLSYIVRRVLGSCRLGVDNPLYGSSQLVVVGLGDAKLEPAVHKRDCHNDQKDTSNFNLALPIQGSSFSPHLGLRPEPSCLSRHDSITF
jgi:hypothetical protein